MADINQILLTPLMHAILERVKANQEKILDWLSAHEKSKELPLYSSVDIRDSGFKAAVVDTNLFPAGFNNLCEHGLEDSVKFIKDAILKRVPKCENILIVAEEHTRNTWYLENIRILEDIIRKAGFHVRIATFLTVQPGFCDSAKSVELETAVGQTVKIYCFKRILSEYQAGRDDIDLIILNNDLTTGIPDVLKEANIPIYPSAAAGWHARHKSHHFCIVNDLMNEFSKIIGLDPWFFSCLFNVVDKVDINQDVDRRRLYDSAVELFKRIETKYKEHKIDQKPYIVLKSDSGTYGMGVHPIEDPQEILNLNRKEKNKLHVGKGAQVIDRYLLQEGVSTIYNIDQEVSEVVIYQIENNLIGGFYRSHSSKGDRENLNSQGASFKKMCPHLKKYGDCGVHHDVNIFDLYRILARIAGIAARREILHLEGNGSAQDNCKNT